jgi:hypothetical protein
MADSRTNEADLLGVILELSPEKRLLGLTAEQRRVAVAELSEEQRLLALSNRTLQQFPDRFLRTLSATAQEALRARIGRPRAGSSGERS